MKKLKLKHKGLFVHKKLDLEEVIPFIEIGAYREFWIEHLNRSVKISIGKSRHLLWKEKTQCACCKLKADQIWIVSDNSSALHARLYGASHDGSFVLLNMDHIIPRSRGGRTTLKNIQLLCEPCNQIKANNKYNLNQLRKLVEQQHGRFVSV